MIRRRPRALVVAAVVLVAGLVVAASPVAPPTQAPVAVSTVARDAAVAAVPSTVVPVRADPRDAAWRGGGTTPALRGPDAPLTRVTPSRTPRTGAVADVPDAVPLPRSAPTRVRIPAIAVDSALVGLGLQDDGRMEVPPGAFPAGWYTGAPTPGELGPAILAGHVDHGGSAGVFSRLHDLVPGDAVEVSREDGSIATFRVTRVEQHRKDAFPTAAVYGDIDHAGLRLVTCGGPFDRRARSYVDNVVVFAELDPGPVRSSAR